LSPLEKEEIERQVKDALLKGLIQPSVSPWATNVILVRKANGKWRMAIDYRALNKVTVKNKYPLPRIDDLFDTVGGSCIWSTLDLTSGYWQLVLTSSSSPGKDAYDRFSGVGSGETAKLEWDHNVIVY
jgi:hypothetical protein